MTPLIRPNQESISLHPELTQEASLEQRILASVEAMSAQLGDLKGQVRDFQTILMGKGDGGETPYGRLPMVEAKLIGHETRIVSLEGTASQVRMYSASAVALGRWAAGLIGAVIGGIVTAVILPHLIGK